MPYRRLPNTDQTRLKAIESALAKAKVTAMPNLAFSSRTLDKLQDFYPRFIGGIKHLQSSKDKQADQNKAFFEILKKAKLYISHFIQVLNLSIIRGEMEEDNREFYGLPKDMKSVPALQDEDDVLRWGDSVIKGELKRTMLGGSPLYSPSIALVKAKYEAFKEALQYQKLLQKNTQKASDKLAEIRKEADAIILQIWNETEAYYAMLPDEKRREEAMEYGVVYIFRPSEKKKVEAARLQTNIIFDRAM